MIELVAGLSIAAILFLGAMSAVTLATRAMPDQGGTVETVLNTAAAIDMLAADLHYATAYTESTVTAVTFQVADRNGDLSRETIRYAWSGTPGDPLTRTYNAGAVANVLDHVQEFALRYEKKFVHCAIRAGTDSSSRLTTAVRILNEPEVTSP